MTMDRRDVRALILGVVLGAVASLLALVTGIGGVLILLWSLVVCPLITSAVAAKRMFLAGLIPNLVLAGAFLIFGPSSPRKQTTGEILYDVLGFIVMAVGLALLAAGAVWLVRKKIMRRGITDANPNA